jgi:hypothetical protein
MEYLVEIIKSLAWPIAAVWLGYIFKGEIRKLLGRVSSLKYKDMEASFEKELADAEIKASKLTQPSLQESTEALSQTDQLLRIAEVSPRAAIVEAWTLIETAALKNGLTSGSAMQRTNPKMIVNYLANIGRFSNESLELIEQLRKLRNRASHMPDFTISQSEAERYLDLAVKSANIINSRQS